jgi:hypothetical protein
MRMDDADRSATIGAGRVLALLMRLTGLILAAAALLAIMLVLLIGGISLHFYVRRRLRQARPRSWDGAIDVEYSVIER